MREPDLELTLGVELYRTPDGWPSGGERVRLADFYPRLLPRLISLGPAGWAGGEDFAAYAGRLSSAATVLQVRAWVALLNALADRSGALPGLVSPGRRDGRVPLRTAPHSPRDGVPVLRSLPGLRPRSAPQRARVAGEPLRPAGPRARGTQHTAPPLLPWLEANARPLVVLPEPDVRVLGGGAASLQDNGVGLQPLFLQRLWSAQVRGPRMRLWAVREDAVLAD